MHILVWLIRLYPRTFRQMWEAEMIETLREARQSVMPTRHALVLAFLAREALSIFHGVVQEWLSVGADSLGNTARERIHWVGAFAIAAAMQAFFYGMLLPIGESGLLTTGVSLNRFGALFLILAAGIELTVLLTCTASQRRRT